MQRTLLFMALAAVAATASAANLRHMLAGKNWAAINQPPARLMRTLDNNHNLDCRLEHYAGGSTLDYVMRQPINVLGLGVEEFYLLHNANGERMLKLVSPAGVDAVRQTAQTHFPEARLVPPANCSGRRIWAANANCGSASATIWPASSPTCTGRRWRPMRARLAPASIPACSRA